jgi:hypothetical protein
MAAKFSQIAVTYEFDAENFLAMFQLGCILILLGLILR